MYMYQLLIYLSTNKTTVSTLTADSSASGVGYAVIGLSGQRLQFGPDGSAQIFQANRNIIFNVLVPLKK